MSEWKSDKCDRHQQITSAGGCSYCECARLRSELNAASAERDRLRSVLQTVLQTVKPAEVENKSLLKAILELATEDVYEPRRLVEKQDVVLALLNVSVEDLR